MERNHDISRKYSIGSLYLFCRLGTFPFGSDKGAHFGHYLIMRDGWTRIVDGLLYLFTEPTIISSRFFGGGELGFDGGADGVHTLKITPYRAWWPPSRRRILR